METTTRMSFLWRVLRNGNVHVTWCPDRCQRTIDDAASEILRATKEPVELTILRFIKSLIPGVEHTETAPFDRRWQITVCYYPKEKSDDIIDEQVRKYRVRRVTKLPPYPITTEEISDTLIRLGEPYTGVTYENHQN